ncbi:uncharacterized protein LOC132197201 [Neocloeon triangulifer]|uniref:uncharacterized protein LOC132197201 n=1 Tax=Neocloeon triangulifer TaxID=2078957 RepID=UPI00286EB71C|nr:uncharacterized protein LOC132197201 [Neocloeon triangulifer]
MAATQLWTRKYLFTILNLCSMFALHDFNDTPEKNNLTKCWSYERSKPFYHTPVFRVKSYDEENLSFKNCGRWNLRDHDTIPPWQLYLADDANGCHVALVSDRIIISNFFCDTIRDKYLNKSNEIQIFGGECSPGESCKLNRGLLSQKVRKLTDVKVSHGKFFENSIQVWEVDRIRFSDSLMPICLWNQNNLDDWRQNFSLPEYLTGNYGGDVNYVPEEKCYLGSIKDEECDLYGKSICTQGKVIGAHLMIYRNGRFFLRGVLNNAPKVDGLWLIRWLDLLPFTRKIVSATPGLVMLPKIPKPKPKVDFGAMQSFADCGRVSRRRGRDDKSQGYGFVLGGVGASRGSAPWHASLTLFDDAGPAVTDFCGATLVSARALITAAHCLFDEDNRMVAAPRLRITLGMNDASNDKETSRQQFMAAEIVLHPGYDHLRKDFKDDIALIILPQDEIRLNQFVCPACLWNDDYQLDKIVNTTGKVFGWGYTAEHKQARVLQEARLKVASVEECYENKPTFFSANLRPTENFWAGFPHNQTTACKGDSGGGLVFFSDDRFFLRGVVSMGRARTVATDDGALLLVTCNPDYFALYTDVTNYMRWIVDNVPDVQQNSNGKKGQGQLGTSSGAAKVILKFALILSLLVQIKL